MFDHEIAKTADGFAAGSETFARIFVHHQINIALTVLDFLVGHAVELVGHGAQALGQHAHAGGVQ